MGLIERIKVHCTLISYLTILVCCASEVGSGLNSIEALLLLLILLIIIANILLLIIIATKVDYHTIFSSLNYGLIPLERKVTCATHLCKIGQKI